MISWLDSETSAAAAISFASLILMRRSRYFTCVTDAGETLSSSTPSPSSKGIISGSPAISPHTPTQMPAAWAASVVILIRRNTAGFVGS